MQRHRERERSDDDGEGWTVEMEGTRGNNGRWRWPRKEAIKEK